MRTEHRVVVGDSRRMAALDDESVELVVTSPPYPMIEMWDDAFAALAPEVERHLDRGDGAAAFDLMHETLRETWREVERVLVDGGIACVNVGDATRSVGGHFRVYQNHARVVEAFADLGFAPLPDVLWRKPTNSAAKFMGSGMLPPNAYATLEHEYLLVFRKGRRRSFEPGADRRYRAAYFWEERNEWFSDVWTDVNGALQSLADRGDGTTDDAGEGDGSAADSTGDDAGSLRERAAAFPLAIPYRLINMYSIYGDTVLDPFWGTGTTSLAAMIAGRNSVGYEREGAFAAVFADRLDGIVDRSREVVAERLDRHAAFVERRRAAGDPPEYDAEHYDFPVTTEQERRIRFYTIDEVEATDAGGDSSVATDGTYSVVHAPLRDADVDLDVDPDVDADPDGDADGDARRSGR